eukprot:403355890
MSVDQSPIKTLFNGLQEYHHLTRDQNLSIQNSQIASSRIHVQDNIIPDPKLFTQIHQFGLPWIEQQTRDRFHFSSHNIQNKKVKVKGKLVKGFVMNSNYYFQKRSQSLSEQRHTGINNQNEQEIQQRILNRNENHASTTVAIDEPQQRTKGSFPSKYQTLIYKKEKPKAFGSSVDRFTNSNHKSQIGSENHLTQDQMQNYLKDDTPGPGSYIKSNQSLIARDNLESMSRKGFGNGFVSRSKRFNLCFDKNSIDYIYTKLKASPGPGSYDTSQQSSMRIQHSTLSTQISTPKKNRSQVILQSLKKLSQKENDSLIMNSSEKNQISFDNHNNTLLFEKPQVSQKLKFKIDGQIKEVTPGPSDYKIRDLSQSMKKYKGITIPKNEQNPTDQDQFEKQHLAPGCYKINEEQIQKRNQMCRIKPPKPPKKNLQIVAQLIDEIHNPPAIQSSLQHLLKFDQIDFEKLEIVNQKDFIGPGTFKPEDYQSIEASQERRNRAGHANSLAFIQPENPSQYREVQVGKSLIGPQYDSLNNPGPGFYQNDNYTIQQRTQFNYNNDGTQPFKSDVIKNEHFLLQLKNQRFGPGPAYYTPQNKKQRLTMNPHRDFI